MTTPHASLEGWTAIVIVSAEGDRMQSSTPTALHAVAGVPMVRLVCDAIREAGCADITIVAPPAVRDAVAEADGLGTAQARAAHAPVAPAGAEG